MLGFILCVDKRVKSLLSKINTQYNLIFRDNCFLFKIVEASFILVNEALTLFIVYKLSERILKRIEVSNIMKVILFCTAFLVIHYLIGAVLLFYNNLQTKNIEGRTLSGDFLISYFLIISAVFFILLFYKETIKTFALSFILADVVSYIIDIKLLIMFMVIGKRRYKQGRYHDNFIVILVSAMIIVIMLVLNLFIGAAVIDGVNAESFSNAPGVFDILYYTVVTFTTIGFGDIVPLNRAAKVMAVIISCTSILCISVFLSSIYSVRSREK